MKPPARLSVHSTCRTLLTRASMVRPSTSNRIVSPTLIRKRSRMLSSIDTSAAPAGSVVPPDSPQNDPSTTRSLVFERRPIRDGVFTGERSAAAHVLVILELNLAGPGRPRRAPGAQAAGAAAAYPRPGQPRSPPLRHRPDRTGCRAGTCRERRVPDPPRTRTTRFSCRERTPRMKKLPRPTASRTILHLRSRSAQLKHRVTLSANHRALASGRMSRIRSEPARCSTRVVAARPDDDHQPDAPRSRLPDRERGQRAGHEPHARALDPVEPGRRRLVAQQARRLDVPHLEEGHQREQQRDEQADRQALERGARRYCIADIEPAGRDGRKQPGHGGHRASRQDEAEETARQSEDQHLGDVDGQQLRRPRTDALEHGDALDLLLDEDAGHAGDANAAEDDDDQADEAQVVLRAREVLADVVLGGFVGPDSGEFCRRSPRGARSPGHRAPRSAPWPGAGS